MRLDNMLIAEGVAGPEKGGGELLCIFCSLSISLCLFSSISSEEINYRLMDRKMDSILQRRGEADSRCGLVYNISKQFSPVIYGLQIAVFLLCVRVCFIMFLNSDLFSSLHCSFTTTQVLRPPGTRQPLRRPASPTRPPLSTPITETSWRRSAPSITRSWRSTSRRATSSPPTS